MALFWSHLINYSPRGIASKHDAKKGRSQEASGVWEAGGPHTQLSHPPRREVDRYVFQVASWHRNRRNYSTTIKKRKHHNTTIAVSFQVLAFHLTEVFDTSYKDISLKYLTQLYLQQAGCLPGAGQNPRYSLSHSWSPLLEVWSTRTGDCHSEEIIMKLCRGRFGRGLGGYYPPPPSPYGSGRKMKNCEYNIKVESKAWARVDLWALSGTALLGYTAK